MVQITGYISFVVIITFARGQYVGRELVVCAVCFSRQVLRILLWRIQPTNWTELDEKPISWMLLKGNCSRLQIFYAPGIKIGNVKRLLLRWRKLIFLQSDYFLNRITFLSGFSEPLIWIFGMFWTVDEY